MYKYLLGKHPKKSPGLPFFKVKLYENRKTNIDKKMNKSMLDLSKDTELLILGSDYLFQKDKKKNNKKTIVYKQNPQESIITTFIRHDKTQKSPEKKTKKKLTKFRVKSNKEILNKRLDRLLLKGKNKKNKMRTSTINVESSKINNISMKKYTSITNYTNRRNENSTERNNIKNIRIKKDDNEKHLFEKVLLSKKINNSTYRNIKRFSNILNDTSKNYIKITMNLKNYSQDNSIRKVKKFILDESLKLSKNQENAGLEPINFRKIFDKKDNMLNKPMKQVTIKQNNKSKEIWIKRSTANLLSFGQVSKSINDEQFYRERKRIIESYREYEKNAEIYIKKKENAKNDYKSHVGIKNLKKIDQLLENSFNRVKNIMEKDNKSNENSKNKS